MYVWGEGISFRSEWSELGRNEDGVMLFVPPIPSGNITMLMCWAFLYSSLASRLSSCIRIRCFWNCDT